MLGAKHTRITFIACVAVLLTACATDVYRNDIATFKKSTDDAIDAFESLRTQVQAQTAQDLETSLAEEGVRVGLVGDCTAVVTDRLQRDSSCLARWASYRASLGDAEQPSCIEPARDLATGAPTFYNLSEIASVEGDLCRLGRLDGDTVHPDQLLAAGVLETTAQLGEKLKQYAAALGTLANAEDTQALRSAAGDATTALEGLADRVETLTREQIPGRQAIRPVGELIGSALVTTLEARRYAALRSIVGSADPVVENAAAILSRNSMPLMIPRLRKAGDDFVDSVNAFNEQPKGAAWSAAMASAREAQETYLVLYQAHPATAFQAMAVAHAALRNALNDPSRQFDAMKSAISDFATKARSAHAAFVAAKASP